MPLVKVARFELNSILTMTRQGNELKRRSRSIASEDWPSECQIGVEEIHCPLDPTTVVPEET